MKLNNILLIVLVIIGIVMIIVGIMMGIAAPPLTGVGFFIIAYLFSQLDKK